MNEDQLHRKKIAAGLCEAVKRLNTALDAASAAGMTIEFERVHYVGMRNPGFVISVMEYREPVLP
jgi:hypothetical protein